MSPKTNRREFMRTCSGAVAAGLLTRRLGLAPDAGSGARLNILLLVADDMNWNAPGCFGGRVRDITPNIDRLASEGMRFERAHITISVCQPSRSALMTGRYPHRNGAEGFQPINSGVPTLQEQLRAAGYLNAILGKNAHLAPREKFCWDYYIETAELEQGRSPQKYYEHCKRIFADARSKGRPLFMMANSHDPHRPFAGSRQEMTAWGKHYPFSRRIEPKEAQVPGFLPDIPDVRKEVSEYLTSVHRCDETVGAVLRALEETGYRDNTLVMFLSDNGMSFPFSKTNCYLNSTRTPWIARWPGRIIPGAANKEHFVSGIDFMPTMLDAAGLSQPPGMDGASFLPLLMGQAQKSRDKVFTQFHETSGRQRYPMRCIQDRKYGYIFNAWSDGRFVFKNESQNGLTMKAMAAAAENNPGIAARVKLFLYRVPEEFYDLESDPDALVNLVSDPKHKERVQAMRREMLQWMTQTKDYLLQDYRMLLEGKWIPQPEKYQKKSEPKPGAGKRGKKGDL